MFDLTSSKLLILGIVALLVVGPKDLPMLLRTIGKYVGMIKRQAAEFRSQFDEAMRDAELQQLKSDVEKIGEDAQKAVSEGTQSFQSEIAAVKSEVEQAVAVTDSSPAHVTAGETASLSAPPDGDSGSLAAPDTDVAALPPPSPAPAAVAAALAAQKSGA
jgi:sec-independent protein translocase protein TatB